MGPKMEKYPLLEKGKLRLLAWETSGKSYLQKEFQKKAVDLITNRSGEWDSRCGRRQVNPISGLLNSLLDFVAEFFHSGLEKHAIAGYRSSISAY